MGPRLARGGLLRGGLFFSLSLCIPCEPHSALNVPLLYRSVDLALLFFTTTGSACGQRLKGLVSVLVVIFVLQDVKHLSFTTLNKFGLSFRQT
ncbi:hypothetical protein F4604DRAFT_1837609 [Suillus subluteus]|nr:hypothetical protein F4604DRAFT_1837609 [Suillus subluteus]